MKHVAFPRQLTLSAQGLTLREWSDEDLPAMIEAFDEPLIGRWTPLASPFDATAARDYLSAARKARNDDRGLQLAITRDGQRVQGEVLLFRTGRPGEAELAYGVGAAHRGQRLAPRAVQILGEYAYRYLGMVRLVLRIDPANAASESVARSAGYTLTDEPVVERARPAGRCVRLRTWRHDAPTGPCGSHSPSSSASFSSSTSPWASSPESSKNSTDNRR